MSQQANANTFRLVASFLAVAGSVWGLFCLLFFIAGDPLHSLVLFGPGYVITVGYICRAILTPSRQWRRVIWGSSALLQGAWLTWFVIETARVGIRGFAFEYLSFGWWAFASVVSVCGFIIDVAEPRVSSAAKVERERGERDKDKAGSAAALPPPPPADPYLPN
jgi:hypothetical protein